MIKKIGILLGLVLALNTYSQDFRIIVMNVHSLSNIYLSGENLSESYKEEVYENLTKNIYYLVDKLRCSEWQETYEMPKDNAVLSYRTEIIKACNKAVNVDSNLVKNALFSTFSSDYKNDVALNERVMYTLIHLEKLNSGFLNESDIDQIKAYIEWHYSKYENDFWRNLFATIN